MAIPPDEAAESVELPLLRSCVRLGRSIFAAASCSVAVLEPDDEHLLFRAASGLGADQVVGMRLPVGKGLAGWAVSSGQAIAVEDVRRDPRFARDVAESTGYVPSSILVAPLPGGADGRGVMEVLDRERIAGRDDLALLGLLAEQASLAMDLADRVASAGRLASSPPAALVANLARQGDAELAAATGLLRSLSDYVETRRGRTGLV